MPSEDQYFRPRNWERFQHYRDRNPSWIKVYNDLLTDYEFGSLTELQQLHLIKLWLLYSRVARALPLCCKHLARHLGADARALSRSINALLSRNFIELCDESASIALAARKQVASPETETETETEREKKKEVLRTSKKPPAMRAAVHDGFDEWWKLYPRKVGKGEARKAYAKALKTTSRETLTAGLEAFLQAEPWRGEIQYCPHASKWLNQGYWENEYQAPGSAIDEEILAAAQRADQEEWNVEQPGNSPDLRLVEAPSEFRRADGEE